MQQSGIRGGRCHVHSQIPLHPIQALACEHNVFFKLGFSTGFKFGGKTQQKLEKVLIALKLHGTHKAASVRHVEPKASVACALRTNRQSGLQSCARRTLHQLRRLSQQRKFISIRELLPQFGFYGPQYMLGFFDGLIVQRWLSFRKNVPQDFR